MTVFFSKITTQWGQVRYVSYRLYSKEPNNCTGNSITQVVIELSWIKKIENIDFHILFKVTS